MEQSQGAGCLPVTFVAGHCEGLEGGDARQGAFATQVGGAHYKGMAIQPMQFALANGLDMATASVIKYVVRKKGDKAKRAEDLKKAIHCIQLLAEHEGIALEERESAVPYICPERLRGGSDLDDMVRAGLGGTE